MQWSDLARASALLRAGEVIGLPTETVYGLAARIDHPHAIERIFTLKERPFFDPLIVHVARTAEVLTVAASVNPPEQALMNALWPGPLTLILPRREDLNPMICAGLDTVAVRAPAHPFARRVIRRAGRPLAAPSANKFGKTSPTVAANVREFWGPDELFVLDGGPCEIGIESTVARILPDGANSAAVEVLRPGGVTGKVLASTLVAALPNLHVTVRYLESTASPGHVRHHYMPVVPLVIVDEPLGETSRARLRADLGFEPVRPGRLALPNDPRIAARMLYAEMRRLCQEGADAIFVARDRIQTGDEWRGIWDRLERAATLDLS